MTDTMRNLLARLSSHMAYMQGQLEAHHALDDPEDFYWYRESVLLRQKVTDALADEPAVPEGREPASVAGRPSVEELALVYHDCCRGCEFMDQGGFEDAAGVVLAHWGNPASVPAEELIQSYQAGRRDAEADAQQAAEAAAQDEPVREVAELVEWLEEEAEILRHINCDDLASKIARAAELLQRQALVPVSVSERMPEPGDCDTEGRCWLRRKHQEDGPTWWLTCPASIGTKALRLYYAEWLSAHALPLPEAK